MVVYDDLYAITKQYIHRQEDQDLIKKAYDVALKSHEG